MRVAVDRTRFRDCRERNAAGAGIGANVDGLHARAPDVEVDRIVGSECPWGLRSDVGVAEIISGIDRGDSFAKRHAPIIGRNVVTRSRDLYGSSLRRLRTQEEEQSNNAEERSPEEMQLCRSFHSKGGMFRVEVRHKSGPFGSYITLPVGYWGSRGRATISYNGGNRRG